MTDTPTPDAWTTDNSVLYLHGRSTMVVYTKDLVPVPDDAYDSLVDLVAEVERLQDALRSAVDLLSDASHHVPENSGLDRRLYAALSGTDSLRVRLADVARPTPEAGDGDV